MLLLKCWHTSHYPRTSSNPPRTLRSSVGTPRIVSRPLCSSVGTLHTVPRPFVQVWRHLVLSQDPLLKCWDTSHCPKTFRPSVGTLRAVPRLAVQLLGHLALSQDPPLKCLDTLHRPMTLRPIAGTLRAVPRLPAEVLGQFTVSQNLPVRVFGDFALSQDFPLKCSDASHCPRTSHSSPKTVPRPSHSSVGTVRTVPRPFVQVLGHFVLSQDYLLKCWDSRISSSLGQFDLLFFGFAQSDLLFFSVGTLRSQTLLPPLEI